MNWSDIVEILITLGVVFVPVIVNLLKERAKGRRRKPAAPVQRPAAVRQPRRAVQPFDDLESWIEMNTRGASTSTTSGEMPGDYYGTRPADSAAAPVSLSEPAVMPAEPSVMPLEPVGLPGRIDDDTADSVAADSPERRRLIDNLIMGEILARKF